MNNSLIIKIFIVCNTSIITKKVCLILKDFTQLNSLFLWLQHIEILSKDKPFRIDIGKFICFYNICRHHTINFRSSPWTKYWTQHRVLILLCYYPKFSFWRLWAIWENLLSYCLLYLKSLESCSPES